jgi:deoxyribose-phosphate aldolase
LHGNWIPLGATLYVVKVVEAERGFANGAREVDMVMTSGALKSAIMRVVERDIARWLRSPHAGDGRCPGFWKPDCSLRRDTDACVIRADGWRRFVKTSNGFRAGGRLSPTLC